MKYVVAASAVGAAAAISLRGKSTVSVDKKSAVWSAVSQTLSDCGVGSSTKLQDYGASQESLAWCKSKCESTSGCTDITWAPQNNHCVLLDGCETAGTNPNWHHYVLTEMEPIREEPMMDMPPADGTDPAEMDHEPFKNPAIEKKYDDLATVNEVLFMIACRSKHTVDVEGLAKERVKKGGKELGMDSDEFMGEVKKIQKSNVADEKKSCGLVNGKHWKKCRAGCAASWSVGAGKNDVIRNAQSEATRAGKDQCISLCEQKYKNFETECEDQAENLQNVYDANAVTMTAGSKCSDLHCPAFPNLVTTAEEEQQALLDEQCGKQCEKKEEGADKCKSECAAKCSLNNLQKCSKDFSKNLNVTVDYCKQMWRWMYDSEEIDPATGNPVVL